ncbi:MAG: PAS domain S-box protein [Pseudomonadota bacterium]
MTVESNATPSVILIVEDEVIIAADLESRLEEFGYEVSGKATSGEQALNMIEERRPDLVMMDIVLKGKLDGIDAAEVIKDRWGLPVVFTTAFADAERLERAKLAYPFGYLLKPFQDRDLGIAVEMALYAAKVEAARAKAESALLEEATWRRMLVQGSRDGIVVLDHQGRVYEANQKFADLLGYSPQEVVDLHVWDWDAQWSREQLLEMLNTIDEAGDYFETCHRRRDGSLLQIEISTNGVLFDGRKLVFCVCRDVTARKKAEESLRESEERHRTILKTAMDGFCLVDQRGRLMEVNESYCRMSGYSEPELLSMSMADLEAYETPALTAARLEKIMKHGADRFESQHRRKDGGLFAVEVSAQYHAEQGGLFVAFIRDITESKRIEAALEKNEQVVRKKLQAILEPEGDIGSLELAEMIDVEAVQSLMNDFHRLTNIGIAILDLKGRVLVATGWQDACTKFHRVHPETSKYCLASDTELSNGVEPGRFKIYRCKNNMWDIATPIMVGGKRLGNLFLGQFFFEHEEPDLDYFRRQALRYGFDEREYLAALDRVPRWSRPTIDAVMSFYSKFAQMLSTLSYSNIKLSRVLAEKGALLTTLRESEEKYRLLVENAGEAIFVAQDGMIKFGNQKLQDIVGRPREEIFSNFFTEFIHPDDRSLVLGRHERRVRGGDPPAIYSFRVTADSDRVRWVEIKTVFIEWLGRPATLNFLSDITARKQAEEALEQAFLESERRTRELQFLLEGSKAILEGGDFNPIARRIFEAAREMTGARSGYVALLSANGEENEVLFLESGGLRCTVDPYLPMPVRGLRGEAYRTGRGVYDNDFMGGPWAGFMPAGHVVLRNVLFAPLNIDGRTAGIMGLANKPGDFTDDDLRMAEAFGGQAAIALQNSRRLEALRESEAVHRALVEGLPDIVMRFDREGRHLFVSSNVAAVVGLEASLFLGKTHRELGFPEHLCRFWEEAVARVFDSAEPFETEFPFHGIDGDTIFNWRLIPEGDADGRVRHVLSISRDITAHRQAERNYQTLFREMLDGFALHEIIRDAEGRPADYRFVAVNPAFERMTGLRAEDIVGRTVLDALPGTEPHWIETYGQVALGGEPVFFENYSRELNKYFEVTAFRPAAGQFACIFQDVTDRKRSEDEKMQLQAQLQQAQKLEAIGALAGGVAHDFNNLLQAINGFSQFLLMNKTTSDPDYPSLVAIQDAGARAAELVRQLLFFSRKADAERRPVELNQEIARSRRMLERTIPRMIEIEVRPGGRLWTIQADPTQIEQILLNLGTNAADAMPDGGKLVIETRNIILDAEDAQNHLGTQPGRYVLLSVTDTGQGMDRETMEKIFEPFFTTKAFGRGTGLGLASVYGIVKSHGGHITCRSAVGRGTKFKIYLPALETAEVDQALEKGPTPVNGGSETVLIVDDEAMVRGIARQAFLKFGYTVLTAASGEEALAIYFADPAKIDLVVLDIGMPGMGGSKCLQEIIRLDPGAKVIIASGYVANGQAGKYLEAGAAGYLGKPFDLAEMLNLARRVLDGETESD